MDKFLITSVLNIFSDDEIFHQLCSANRDLTMERDKNGNISVIPPTGSETGNYNYELGLELGIWNRQYQLGKIFDSSTGFTLPNTAVRSPDLSWIPNEKWNAIPAKKRKKFAPICPDFIIELMFENDKLDVLQEKMDEYMEQGTRLGWLFDRKKETVYIYQKDKEIVIVNSFKGKLSGGDVLPKFELYLAILK